MKRIGILALLMLMLLLLIACGKPKTPQPTPDASAKPGESPVPAADTRYLRYDVTEEKLFDLSYADHDLDEKTLVLLGTEKKGSRVLLVPLDGSEEKELILEKAFQQIAAGKDCLWLGSGSELVRLSLDGQETLSLTLPEKIEDLMWDETGRLLAAHRDSLTLVREDGQTESVPLPKGFTGGTLCRLGSGENAVFASRVKGEVSRLQRLSGTELIPVDTGDAAVGVLASGDASADFYYVEWTYSQLLSEARQVCRCSGGQSAPVFDLSGAGREGKIRGLCPSGKDFLLLYAGDDGAGLLRFTPTEAEKKVLTVARLNTNANVTELIARFNRENPEYYLVNRFYNGMDYDEQAEQLELDILAGDRPDLLDTMAAAVEVYGAKGLLRDLYPMLEADPDLSREDLMPSVLHAMEAENGALYQLWPVFSLWTCAEPRTYVGDAERWTLEDLVRICEENPELTLYGNYGTPRQLLGFVLPGVVDRFADFETGDLRFDSPEFVEFLRFMEEMFQRARDYAGGEILLYVNHFGAADDFALGLATAEEWDLRFTGFPFSGGTGQLCNGLYSFSIFEGTGNEEDAWAFLRWLLSEETQESLENGMPLRRSVLLSQLEALENGTPERTVTRFVDPAAAATGESSETVTYTIPAAPPLPEEQMADVLRMLEGIEGIYADPDVHPFYYVIWEECAKLFNGAKSPEDTAKAIQDRLSIYVAERSK